MDPSPIPAGNGPSPALEIRGLAKVYRSGWRRPPVTGVRDLDLAVRHGEVFGLLGPNGSGKSTTLKVVVGLLRATSGTVRLLGHPAGSPEALARIGFLPEESNFYRFLSARRQLDFFGRLFRLPSRVRRERIDRLIDRVGLAHAADRPIAGYSKGMARRVGLAQALLNDPELIILDEPTSGLDPIGAREVKDLILDWKREGKTVLVSSHLLADMESVCDRIAILAGGRLRLEGPVAELLADPGIWQVDVAGLDEAGRNELVEFVGRHGGRVAGARHPQGRLEELFLRVVREEEGGGA